MERTNTSFTRLNEGWNAEPGTPYPEIRVSDRALSLSFYLNPWAFPGFKLGDLGELSFAECWRYRLGPPDEDQWYRGQCRFSRRVPDWGEFYEVTGDLRLDRLPLDAWSLMAEKSNAATRHFLFYFKDETFECDAASWKFKVIPAAENATAYWKTVRLPSGSSVTLISPRSANVLDDARAVRPVSPEPLTARLADFFRRFFRNVHS